jgi:PHP family Zn ribbon phosphoesterase
MMVAFVPKQNLRTFQADLHIHSCLSPCGDWEMGPMNIIDKSLEMDLDIIAICDHNSSENADAVMKAGKKKGITVLPGLEVCSKEEVHVLAVFDELSQAVKMQEYVYHNLKGENTPKIFGHQVIANCKNEVTGENKRLLIGATDLQIHEIVNTIQRLGGLSFASHIDKQAFSIIKQLGFVPSNLSLDGVELSPFAKPGYDLNQYPGADALPVITSSDAHFLADIGKARTNFYICEPTVSEIRLALKAEQGRKVEV